MSRRPTAPSAALLAAAVTTITLFSAVAGLADGDRVLLLAAKNSLSLIASNASAAPR
jgi:hypothetical protein